MHVQIVLLAISQEPDQLAAQSVLWEPFQKQEKAFARTAAMGNIKI